MARLTLYQGRPAARLPPRHLERIRATRPDLVCLPEYFWVPAGARSYIDAVEAGPAALAAVARLSEELDAVVVGGSYVKGEAGWLHNVAPVFERGRLVGEHAKLKPTERELKGGIRPGTELTVFRAGGLRLGVLICADVLDPGSFAVLGAQGVDLILAPTLSPYRPDDTPADRSRRDRAIFVDGARRAGAPVGKCCGVGRIFRGRLQGRSLVVGRDGSFLARVPPEGEQRLAVLSVEL